MYWEDGKNCADSLQRARWYSLGGAADPTVAPYTFFSKYVGVTPSTFDQMVSDGRMPKPVQLGDESVWDLEQLDKSFNRLAGLARNQCCLSPWWVHSSYSSPR